MEKGENNMSIVRKIGVFLFVLFVLLLLSCSNDNDNDKEIMNIDYNNGVLVRDGVEYKTYQLNEGETGLITIKINKTSGKINIDVYNVNNKNKPDYSGRNIELDYFTVKVSDLGEYNVRIECFSFIGDYEISFKIDN